MGILATFTISSIPSSSPYMWGPHILAWIYTVVSVVAIHNEFNHYVGVRTKFVHHGDPDTSVQTLYSVLVENLPITNRSSKEILKLFEGMFGPESIHSARGAIVFAPLQKKVSDRDSCKWDLEIGVFLKDAAVKRGKSVPQITITEEAFEQENNDEKNNSETFDGRGSEEGLKNQTKKYRKVTRERTVDRVTYYEEQIARKDAELESMKKQAVALDMSEEYSPSIRVISVLSYKELVALGHLPRYDNTAAMNTDYQQDYPDSIHPLTSLQTTSNITPPKKTLSKKKSSDRRSESMGSSSRGLLTAQSPSFFRPSDARDNIIATGATQCDEAITPDQGYPSHVFPSSGTAANMESSVGPKFAGSLKTRFVDQKIYPRLIAGDSGQVAGQDVATNKSEAYYSPTIDATSSLFGDHTSLPADSATHDNGRMVGMHGVEPVKYSSPLGQSTMHDMPTTFKFSKSLYKKVSALEEGAHIIDAIKAPKFSTHLTRKVSMKRIKSIKVAQFEPEFDIK